MKKLIALVLALLMACSACVVAFAADAEAPAAEESTTAAAEDDGFNFEDIPAWTIGPGLKIAKIALKIAKVFLKIALIFNAKGVIEKIQDFINSIEKPDEEPVTTPAAELA